MLLRKSGFLPEPRAKIQKSLELCAVVRKKIKIWPKSLEDKLKMPIFATSEP